jgi:hypothetical protein
MDVIEYIIYTILLFVLIAFIGVLGYIIYDNYTYKKDLKLDLNTNFKDINNNFDSTSNIINSYHGKQTNNLNMVNDKIDNYNKIFTSNILDINSKYNANSNIFLNNISDINNKYSNNISDINYKLSGNSNLFENNIGTFSDNLNKYFSFNINDNTKYGDANKKIFEYRTTISDSNNLNLITKTTATAGLKINSDADKELEICNKLGTSCYNISSDNDNLYIYKKGGVNNIYIGGKDENAPFKIVKGVASINGVSSVNTNVGQISASSGSKTTALTFTNAGKGYTGHIQNPTLTIVGGNGNGLQIGNFTYSDDDGRITGAIITNHGSGYTGVPTITLHSPPINKPVLFTATPTATPTINTNSSTGALTNPLPSISPTTIDNGYYKKITIVNIINNSRKAGAIAETDSNGNITKITIINITANGAIDDITQPIDNGFYVAENVQIISINGVSISNTLTFNRTVINGVLTSITLTGQGWSIPGALSRNNLSVILSNPETPVQASISPDIRNGSIISLTLTVPGSKYYKPTLNVNDSNLANPQQATISPLSVL